MVMSREIEVHVIATETIKPSSPTPKQCRELKLSLLDQLSLPMATPILLFYPLKANHLPTQVISKQLKSSLSKALTLFYPLAGRIKDNCLVECNDSGVEYVEAHVNCSIWNILKQPDSNVLEKFIPVDIFSIESNAIIQVNFFACGGLAIGIGISHKVCDGASIGMFIMNWAAGSLSGTLSIKMSHELLPIFVADTVIPSMGAETGMSPLAKPSPLPVILETNIKSTARRYVFIESKVALLKAKAAIARMQRPVTRVEVVTAFIWKCLMTVARSKSGHSRQSVLVHSVNLRQKLKPPLTRNYIGNLTGKFLAKAEGSHLELQYLVGLLRKGLEQTNKQVSNEQVSKGAQSQELIIEFSKEFAALHGRDDVDLYTFTSLCRFPFYEADFGWGRPIWATVTNLLLTNYVILMDTRDGKGIDAWLSLAEEDVSLLESNQELLAFADTNPDVHGGKIFSSL